MNSKLALYTRPYPRVDSYYKLIDLAAFYGLETVEGFCHMELTEPDRAAAARIREYADRKGVGFCCFSVYADLVGTDAPQQLLRLKGFADVAEILGSPYLHHTVSPGTNPARDGAKAAEDAFQRGIAGIREIYDYAASRKIRTIYEDQGLVFNGVDPFARLIREVDRDIGIVADFGNIYQADERIEPFIRRFGSRIVHVHLKDMRELPDDSPVGYPTREGHRVTETEIGTGTVGFTEGIRLLREAGYTGYYALEYGAPSDDSPLLTQALCTLSDYLDTP